MNLHPQMAGGVFAELGYEMHILPGQAYAAYA